MERLGDFDVSRYEWGTRIECGGRSVNVLGDLNQEPVLSLNGRRLVYGNESALSFVGRDCKPKVISNVMEYPLMPYAATPGTDRVLFYNGAPHYLPADMESRSAFDTASQYHVIEAWTYDGEFIWKKSETDVGWPIAALPGKRFLTIRWHYPEVGINDFLFRIIDGDAHRIRAWRIPISKLATNEGRLQAGDFGGFELAQRRGATKDKVKFDLRAPPPYGTDGKELTATLTIDRRFLTLAVYTPLRVTVRVPCE